MLVSQLKRHSKRGASAASIAAVKRNWEDPEYKAMMSARSSETCKSRIGSKHPRWSGDNASYYAIHKRLTRQFGRAAEYGCWGWPEADCDNQAREWSYIHDADPVDLDSYIALCKPCHSRYDGADPTKARQALFAKYGPEGSTAIARAARAEKRKKSAS